MLTPHHRHPGRRPRQRSAQGHRLAIALAVAAVGFGSAVAAPAVVATVLASDETHPITAVPHDRPALGMVYTGLNPAKKGAPCVGAYEVAARSQCSHGPDLPPPGLNVKQEILPAAGGAPAPTVPERDTTAGPTEADLTKDENGFTSDSGLAVLPEGGPTATTIGASGVACEGDGTSGKRVQVLYVRDAGVTSRLSLYLESFRTWAAGVDAIYDASAQETGGSRHVRYVTTPDCRVDVQEVEVPAGSMTTFNSMISALTNQGINRPDRKYLIFGDAKIYCGIGTFAGDETPTAANRSNTGPSYGRSDAGCWTSSVAAHELGHTLGAVNNSAPNSSKAGHCTDDHDIMCYADTAGLAPHLACPDLAHEQRLDCNHDDYYNTNPSPGSYLATHWNTANNSFLINTDNGGATDPPPAPGGTTAPPPTTVPPSPTASPSTLSSPSGSPSASPSKSASTLSGRTSPSATASPSPSTTTPTVTTRSTTANPSPPAAAGLKELAVSETTTSSTRLSWAAVAPTSRYAVLVNGKSIGRVSATTVRIVGMRADTEYHLAIAVAKPDGSNTALTTTVTMRTATSALPGIGTYLVVSNALSSRVADLYGARSAEGTPLVLDNARGATNQQWKLESTAGGSVLIRSRVSGRCVAPKDGTDSVGTPLVQVTCDQTDAAQRWRIATTPYGFSITSDAGLVVGVGNSRYGGGRLLVLQRAASVRYQSWTARGA